MTEVSKDHQFPTKERFLELYPDFPKDKYINLEIGKTFHWEEITYTIVRSKT